MNTIQVEAGFRTGQSAAVADSSLKTAVREMDGAQHRAVLWFADIMNRRLYRMLGYSNMAQYATAELNFSKTRVGDFIRLVRKLDQLPAVKQSLASGDLGYTKAVEIIKVATPLTQNKWVEEAAGTGRRELANKVKRVRAMAQRRRRGSNQESLLPDNRTETSLAAEVPVRIGLELTPEQFARLEALLEKVQKLGAVSPGSSKAETMLAGLDSLVKGTSDGASTSSTTGSAEPTRRRVFRAPFQIHVHQCPDCAKSSVQTGRGEMDLSKADSDRAECDATVKQPGRSNKTTIPPSRRVDVLRRDRFRCRAPGCGNTRFLEVHHLKPRARGGGHELANLVTLCSGCHRLHHEGRLRIQEPIQQPLQCPAGHPRTSPPDHAAIRKEGCPQPG